MIGVIYEQVPAAEMVSFYDFILQLGPITEMLAKSLVTQLMHLIEYMQG